MLKKITTTFVLITALVLLPIEKANATDIESNNLNNKGSIIIEDDADLLTETEEQELKMQVEPLSEFGIVMFKTTNTYNSSTSLRYIQNYYYSKFGNQRGVAFYIDMSARQVCACATGGLDKIITSSKCDTIMDNVYTYARRGDYYGCAKETFMQMNRLLSGGRIAESMKYYCNAILAIMISLFTSYGFFMLISGNNKASKNELIEECAVSLEHSPIEVTKTGTHRVYSPVSDSSSSGGSSGGFSGGGRRWRILWKRRKPRLLKLISEYSIHKLTFYYKFDTIVMSS